MTRKLILIAFLILLFTTSKTGAQGFNWNLFVPIITATQKQQQCNSDNLVFNHNIIKGRVVGISDGDTITILDSTNTQHKIRLYGIDCPESGQAFGQAAKEHTSMLAAGKQAVVEIYDVDQYGRTVGVVYTDCLNVNLSLIRNGYAWQYRKYCTASFCDSWLAVEDDARNKKLGLWSDPNPIPPWEWRNGTSYPGTIYSEYHGNVSSHKFHSPACRYYNCSNCTKVFKTRDEAIAAGYEPCGICKP